MTSAARKPAASADEHPELEHDPVWQAFQRAPVGPPDTDEERKLLEEARAGSSVSGHVVSAEVAERCRRGE